MRSHDELDSLVAGYVLRSLEPEEREAFEAHLVTCDRCAQRVVEMRATAGALALLAEDKEPPPELRGRILAAARAEKASTARPRQARKGWWQVLTRPAAVAAVMGLLLLAVVGLAFWVSQLQKSLDTRQLRISRGYQAITIMAQAEHRWRLERTDVAPGANGILSYSSQQSAACLVVWDLPPAQGKRYHAWTLKDGAYTRIGAMWRLGEQLWIIIPGSVDQLDAVAVTLEETPNPKEPTGRVVARVPLSKK